MTSTSTALFAAAAETGTAMEIDGAPGHLDMDGLWRDGRSPPA